MQDLFNYHTKFMRYDLRTGEAMSIHITRYSRESCAFSEASQLMNFAHNSAIIVIMDLLPDSDPPRYDNVWSNLCMIDFINFIDGVSLCPHFTNDYQSNVDKDIKKRL